MSEFNVSKSVCSTLGYVWQLNRIELLENRFPSGETWLVTKLCLSSSARGIFREASSAGSLQPAIGREDRGGELITFTQSLEL
jgi:hypothetical protein